MQDAKQIPIDLIPVYGSHIIEIDDVWVKITASDRDLLFHQLLRKSVQSHVEDSNIGKFSAQCIYVSKSFSAIPRSLLSTPSESNASVVRPSFPSSTRPCNEPNSFPNRTDVEKQCIIV